MENKIKISPGFFLTEALAILLMPLRWVVGFLAAALVHELCHCIAVTLCGGQILSCSIGALGAKIEASPMRAGKEALCSMAGPAGSFLMLLIARFYPEASICGLIQGIYNLLPLYPLDGGRIMRCLLPDSICCGIRAFTLTFLTGLGLRIMTFQVTLGILLLLSIWFPALKRKISCKDAR